MRIKVFANNNKGMGLLEVMISMIILAIGILGLAPMLVMSIHGNSISRDNSTVSNMLKEKVEYFNGYNMTLLTMPFDTIDTINGIYTRTISIADSTCDITIPPGLYKIDVEVAWTDHQNLDRASTYSTYILKTNP